MPGHRRNADDRGHKDPGHLVGGAGQGRLGGGGIRHQADDLAQSGILPHPGGPAGQRAVLVDGGGADGAARGLVHRHALAGEGGFVDAGLPFQHGAVHRDAFPGTHQEDVPHPHLFHRNGQFPFLPQNAGGGRGQLHQAFQSTGGLALGVGFQHLAHRDKCQDHGSGFKIQIVAELHDLFLVAGGDAAPDHEDGKHAVDQRRPGAHGHQGVHARGKAAHAFPAADEESPVDPAHRQGQRQLGQTEPQSIPAAAVHEGRQGQADHMPHAQIHQGHQETQAGEQAAFQFGGLGIFQGVGIGFLSHRRAVTGPLHRRNDIFGHGIGFVFHLHTVGEQAHRHPGDPGYGGHCLFHMGTAGRTAHAGHFKPLHRYTSFPLRYRVSSAANQNSPSGRTMSCRGTFSQENPSASSAGVRGSGAFCSPQA